MNITQGAWLLCSILATNNNGTTKNYMMPAQVVLEASFDKNIFVDFTAGLIHNNFPLYPVNDPIKTLKITDCVIDYHETERKPEDAKKTKIQAYKENN